MSDYPEFQHVHFQALNSSDVIKAFPEWDKDLADQAWRKWLEYYLTKARICYQAQLHNHYEVVWQHFCKVNGLSIDIPVGDYDDDGDTMAASVDPIKRQLAPAVRCGDVDVIFHLVYLARGWAALRECSKFREYDLGDPKEAV